MSQKEPMKGLEPLTTRLQGESSTTELHRHEISVALLSSAEPEWGAREIFATSVYPGERGSTPSRARTSHRPYYGRASPEDSAEHSRGDGLSSPWSPRKNRACTLSSARLSKLVLVCYTFVAVEQLKK